MNHAEPGQPLSERQREVLHWAAHGKTTNETAVIMGITRTTVSNHMWGAKERLDALTVPQAAVLFYRANRLSLERAPDLTGLARLLSPAAWERGASRKSREFALHQAKEVLAFLGISHDQREG